MDIDKAADHAASFLPTKPAKVALLSSVALAGMLYALLRYLDADTLLPLAQAQKLSLLLIPGLLLLVGSWITLYLVVRAFNNKKISITISGLNDEEKP